MTDFHNLLRKNELQNFIEFLLEEIVESGRLKVPENTEKYPILGRGVYGMADLDPCQCGLFHVTTVNGRQEPAVWLVREAGETLYQGAIYLGKDGKVYQSRPSEIAK